MQPATGSSTAAAAAAVGCSCATANVDTENALFRKIPQKRDNGAGMALLYVISLQTLLAVHVQRALNQALSLPVNSSSSSMGHNDSTLPLNATADGAQGCSQGFGLRVPELPAFYTGLHYFHSVYVLVHPHLCVLICCLGTVMNIVTIVILTQKSMLTSINLLLSVIAACDVIVMCTNLVFVLHFLIIAELRCEPGDYSYAWATFMFAHANVSVIMHSSSLWLTVALATVRVVSINRSVHGHSECLTLSGSCVLSLLTLLLVCVVNTPNMFTFFIAPVPAAAVEPCILQLQAQTPVAPKPSAYMVITNQDDCTLKMLAFWSNGLIFKVVPCLLLTVFIGLMLRLLRKVNSRRKRMGIGKGSLAQSGTDKTTKMLVAVLSVFLLTELPQGLLTIMTGFFTGDFHEKIYQNVGDFMDLLSLINSAVNFIIYCAMSAKFREVFSAIFVPKPVEEAWTRYTFRRTQHKNYYDQDGCTPQQQHRHLLVHGSSVIRHDYNSAPADIRCTPFKTFDNGPVIVAAEPHNCVKLKDRQPARGSMDSFDQRCHSNDDDPVTSVDQNRCDQLRAAASTEILEVSEGHNSMLLAGTQPDTDDRPLVHHSLTQLPSKTDDFL